MTTSVTKSDLNLVIDDIWCGKFYYIFGKIAYMAFSHLTV